MLVHPEQFQLELIGHFRRILRSHDHITPADVHLVRQGQGNRLPGHCLVLLPIICHHGLDLGHGSRRQNAHAVPRLHTSRSDAPSETAKVEVGPVDPLDRHAERALCRAGANLHRLEKLEQGASVIPGHPLAAVDDIVPIERGERNAGDRVKSMLRDGGAVFLGDRLKDVAVIVDQIHLVDGHGDMTDADHGGNTAVPARLRQNPFARIDQDDGGIGGRGAGGHVARVLFMARRVGNDELALVRCEEAVGDVDGDPLLALGAETVHQQREIKLLALGPKLFGFGFQGLQLIFEDQLGFIEQPPDQGGLAVIHRTAGDEAQKPLVVLRLEIALDARGIKRVCRRRGQVVSH